MSTPVQGNIEDVACPATIHIAPLLTL